MIRPLSPVLAFGTAVALLAVACGTDLGSDADRVEGSGTVVEETREIDDFDNLELAGEGRVTFGAAAEGTIVIEADENLMELIETDVSSGRLTIATRSGTDIDPTQGVEYRVGCPATMSVELSGAGEIDLLECLADQVELRILGSGAVRGSGLDAASLAVEIAGTGGIELDGSAETLLVAVPGVGSFEGADLMVEAVEIDIAGDGSVIVWAVDSLHVEIAGKGQVGYYGTPQVDQSVVGVGSVESLGDR